MFVIHSFVNIFAGGRSESKAVLFVLYVIFLAGVFFIFRNKRFARTPLRWWHAALTLGGIYLYGLILHILYASRLGLHLTDFIITANNNELSSSTLWHTHIAKGAVGQLLALFDKSQLVTIDAGGAYLQLFPSWVFFVGSALLILILLQAVFSFVFLYIPFLNKFSKRQRWWLFLGYSIVSFSIIKTAIDGGIFSPAGVIGAFFIGVFIYRLRRPSSNTFYAISIFSIISFVVAGLCVDSFQFGDPTIIFEIAALSTLYLIILYGTEQKLRYQLFVPLAFLFLCTWWLVSDRDRAIHTYAQTKVDIDQTLYLYDNDSKRVEVSKSTSLTTVGALTTRYGRNVSYMPVMIPGVTCMSRSFPQIVSFELITKVSPKQIPSTSLISVSQGKSSSQKGYTRTPMVLRLDPCLPEPLSAIDGLFRGSGLLLYGIVNPVFYDDAHTF